MAVRRAPRRSSCKVTARELATLELEALLGQPTVRGRWPGGVTTDDVLAALHEIGRPHVRIHDAAPDGDGHPTARYTCAVELRAGTVGIAVGRGRTLTVAALRCLIDAEDELADEVRRGLTAFGDFLDGG